MIGLGPDLEIEELVRGAFVIGSREPYQMNALLVELENGELVLVDTLRSSAAAQRLLVWIDARFPGRPLHAINTHFHDDRTGGNRALLERGVPVHASEQTARLLAARYPSAPKPDRLFRAEDGLLLGSAGDLVEAFFPGPGHSPDNLVVYFHRKKILFGGCLILAGDAVGNRADADLARWSRSLDELSRFPAEFVVPGHGARRDPELVAHSRRVLASETGGSRAR